MVELKGTDEEALVPARATWRSRIATIRRPRLNALDWIALALLVLGALSVALGLLPRADAAVTLRRILPLLLFLAGVIVLAELTARAELFDVVAVRLARLVRRNRLVLFCLCVAFASASTAFLN